MTARAMAVVMLTPSATGGHARYTWELMRALRAHAPPSELSLTLLTSADLDPEFRTEAYAIADVLPPLRLAFPSRVHWAVGRTLHYVRREEAVLGWLRARAPGAVVHYQEPPFASPVHLRRVRAAGALPVATVHNLRPHDYPVPAARRLSDLTARLGWRRCAALFVHSDGLKAELGRELGPGAPPVVTVPHGVWTGHGAGAPAPSREGHLLLFGVMRRNKGLHLALDALGKLPGRRLVLAGAFPDRAFAREIAERVARERLAVELLDGTVPEDRVGGLFGGAALVLLPYTEFHAQSGVLHLAIAYGVPVVATDVGALGEGVRREGIGLVAPPGDAAAFARTVLAALEPAAWSGARARCAEAAGRLSWAEAARVTFEAYARVRAGTRRQESHA